MQRTINGKDYSFNMTRQGLRAAERMGFTVDSISSMPNTAAVYLWYAALGGKIPLKKAEELLDDYLDDPNCPETFADVFESLADAYGSAFE